MTERTLSARPQARQAPVIPSAVIGTLIFVVAETMLFLGLISAFMIVKTQAIGGWPPLDQPRLPIEETAFNTLALLLSGAFLFAANRIFTRDPRAARAPLAIAIALGIFFVGFQGLEWAALLDEGLGLTTSTHGAFFYLIVGTHAAHAAGGLGVLIRAGLQLVQGRLEGGTFQATQLFWYFVVALWPLLYWLVYL